MKCPRCGRDSTDGAAICRRCGAPLAIPDEPEAGPLDAELDLDRRARHTLPGPPSPLAPRRPAAGSALPPVRPPVRPPPPPLPAVAAPVNRAAPPPPPEPPDFFEPPFTPAPKPLPKVTRDAAPSAEITSPDLAHLPRQEHPPGYGDGDGYVFADLPEDDPPELSEPPATLEADEAFAALTERVRGETPAPAAAPPAEAPPPQPHWPLPPPEPQPGERPALELFDPTPAPKPPAPPRSPAPPAPAAKPQTPAPPRRPPSSPAVRAAPPPLPPQPPPAAPPAAAAPPEVPAPPAPPRRPPSAPAMRAVSPPSELPKTPPRARQAPRPPPDLELPEAEVTSIEVHVTIPPPWRRAAAWAVDAVPFAALVGAVAAWLPGKPGQGGLALLAELALEQRAVALSVAAFLALLLFTYGTLAHALAGATLGKRLLGLRLVASDGGRPSIARCAVRSALSLVSLGLLGLGFLLALFTRTGRSLHDLVARTWVVEAP